MKHLLKDDIYSNYSLLYDLNCTPEEEEKAIEKDLESLKFDIVPETVKGFAHLTNVFAEFIREECKKELVNYYELLDREGSACAVIPLDILLGKELTKYILIALGKVLASEITRWSIKELIKNVVDKIKRQKSVSKEEKIITQIAIKALEREDVSEIIIKTANSLIKVKK